MRDDVQAFFLRGDAHCICVIACYDRLRFLYDRIGECMLCYERACAFVEISRVLKEREEERERE